MTTVEFFFDLSSPYSYLASTQIEEIAARNGAQVVWRPMVLGAVFKAAHNVMPAQSPPKARYMMSDLERWARHYRVPFRFSSRFPVNAIAAMRLVLVADDEGRGRQLATAAFRAMWVEDRDITAPAELEAIARVAGLDPATALARTEQPAVKERLRANTDEAVRRGAFGAPAFFVGEQLFWGNDRLAFLEEALSPATVRGR